MWGRIPDELETRGLHHQFGSVCPRDQLQFYIGRAQRGRRQVRPWGYSSSPLPAPDSYPSVVQLFRLSAVVQSGKHEQALLLPNFVSEGTSTTRIFPQSITHQKQFLPPFLVLCASKWLQELRWLICRICRVFFIPMSWYLWAPQRGNFLTPRGAA